MKFLHTSDLHIGLRLCEYSMIEDCRHILAEIAEIAAERDDGAAVAAVGHQQIGAASDDEPGN